MGNTAVDEQRGGSIDVTVSSASTYRARLPWGPNGVRLYVIRPTVAGVKFQLPDPALCSNGAEPLIVVINKGSQSLQVINYAGVNVGAALAANNAYEIWLPSIGTDLWIPLGPSAVMTGAALNDARKPLELVYTASSTAGTNFRTDAAKQFGYIGADGPVSLQVTIKTGVVLGQPDLGSAIIIPPLAGVTTGSWPAGTTCLLTLESGAYIQGRGGSGGGGATAPFNTGGNGQQGGSALECRVPTVIQNNGFIRGGGGGGGGGNRITTPSSIAGGNGGGGAGAPGGSNGTGSQAGTLAAGFEAGGSGGQLTGGYAGGAGGGPGLAGSPGFGLNGATGGTGGAAGPAIRRLSSVTVTQLGSGSYIGGVSTF